MGLGKHLKHALQIVKSHVRKWDNTWKWYSVIPDTKKAVHYLDLLISDFYPCYIVQWFISYEKLYLGFMEYTGMIEYQDLTFLWGTGQNLLRRQSPFSLGHLSFYS